MFGDTINGLGGNAVPMAWGEVITAAKQGVIDGGDLPIVNMKALKVYEVSKYASMTYHNYGPTNAVMNLEIWNGLSAEHKKLMLDVSREAQEKIREATELVDNFAKAKSELEPLGMTVVEAKVDGIPQGGAGEDLAGLQEPVRRAVGRDRGLQGLKLAVGIGNPAVGPDLPPVRPIRTFSRACCGSSRAVSPIRGHGADHLRHRQPADRRDPALFRRRDHRLARRRSGAVHLGRGGRRTVAGLADLDRRRDRHPAALAFHAARVRAPPAGDRAALDPPLQSRADRRLRRCSPRGTAASSACSTARSPRRAQINLAWLYASAVVGGVLIAVYGIRDDAVARCRQDEPHALNGNHRP